MCLSGGQVAAFGTAPCTQPPSFWSHPERVVGGDAAKHKGVAPEGSKEVDRLHDDVAGRRRREHRGVVGAGRHAEQHAHVAALAAAFAAAFAAALALSRAQAFFLLLLLRAHPIVEPRQRARERARADLGAAAAAAHLRRREQRERAGARGRVHRAAVCCCCASSCASHAPLRCSHGHLLKRQLGAVLVHEGAVNPILPSPRPRALKGKGTLGAHRVGAAGADEAEERRLRAERHEGLARQPAAQVLRERRPLAHGEDAGLGARVRRAARDVAGGEDVSGAA